MTTMSTQNVPLRTFRDKVTGVLVWWGFVIGGDYSEWDERIENDDFDLEPGKWRFDEGLQEWVPYVPANT